MIRIGRLTDYGIIVMTHLAGDAEGVHTAPEIAAEAHLPLPTVSKLLRTLAREGLLESHRGVRGGYGLARRAEQISVGQIIAAFEGPIAITTCSTSSPGDCEHERRCPVRGHWNLINLAIREALESITLADLAARPRGLLLPTLRTLRPALTAPPSR